MENMRTDQFTSISLHDIDDAYVEAKAYYGNLLAGMDKDMFPLDDVEGKAKGMAQFIWSSDVDVRMVKEFCAKHDFTEKDFFNACFAYVLTKFTGRDEVFYATVYDGRRSAGSALAARLPEKTFPVRLPVEDNESIVSFVCQMGQQLSASMAHVGFSFADIAHEYDLTAELVFAYQGEEPAEEDSSGEKGDSGLLSADESTARLYIEVYIRDGKAVFGCEYRCDCYSEELARSILCSLAEAAKEFPVKERLADVSLLSKETEAKLDCFNETEVPYDKSQTVVTLFRRAAQEYADCRAVVFDEKEYCYAEVDAMSEKIAAYLVSKGLGRGDVVAILIPRSAYMPIAALGALKAGCAYQPLDPTYPEERLNFMVQDSVAKLLITTKELRPMMTEYQGEVLLVEDISSLPRQQVSCERGPAPEDTFILLYTSGSTGVPKGVRLSHANLVCFINWYQRFYGLTAEDCVGAYASYGFDANMMDTYPALTCGAAVYIVNEEMRFDLAGMNACFEKHRVTHVFMTTQVARQFVQAIENSSLKCLSAGGEKLATLEPPKNYAFYNGYGPTENTIFTTIYKVEQTEKNIPIGKPLDNVKLYIVDKNGKRLPPGACGELWVAGPQVGGGYLNRPEKTAEVFIPNPFEAGGDYGRVYRTGDIVRYRRDGNIEFLGRKDGQVKVRGFRIELSEVEAVLREFPGVKDAAAAAFDHPGGGKFIAAYVVGDTELDTQAIGEFIGERKPPYMVPEAFMQLDKIPLNQNSKVNRKALPVPELHIRESVYVPPRNETEKELCRGFATALGMERASAEEDFFQAGGDSLRIVRLLSECRALKLNFNLIYEGKTPAGIAELLGKRAVKGEGKKRDTHFLGPVQRQHYDWGNSLEEGYGLHCDATVYLDPGTDMERLAEAIEKTLLAHPAVDARLIETEDGTLRWKKGDMQGVRPVLEELSRADYDELRKSIRQPMNKTETRMFVTRLFAIREADGSVSKAFYFDFLHPIIDGDSVDIFLADVDAAYRGEALQPEEYSIFDYYDEIEDTIPTPAYKEEQQWNRDFVASFTDRPGEIPGDLDPQGENETKDIMVPIHVDLQKVDAFTRANGITDGTILAAAFGLLQSLNNGEQAAAILTIYNGRDDIRYERTVGAVYRHYPLCVRWQEDMTAENFVKETQANILLCRRHALYESDPVPIISAFSYQGEDVDGFFDFCEGKARYEVIEDFEEENFDFFVHRRQDDFYCNLTYNTREYSEAYIARFLENYQKALHALAEGKKLAEIVKLVK